MDKTEIKKGDIVVCVLSGNYGKPRPAVIVQSNSLNKTLSSILVCPITSYLINTSNYRLPLNPTKLNGLKSQSCIMVDKINMKIGKLSSKEIIELNKALKYCQDLD
ncbi:type II toxin-antitoxin system PemK/MazF family toxin [Rickettsia endosymbiont of Pantilius tunicatus]|uniref:type II toxin-antitoxin system PemK/MazF family toxin n=1 Tax=unclassified Rickettsia TaxID=114295 RepID=UPI00376EF659